MLLHENKTIFWDYIRNTEHDIDKLTKDINNINISKTLKQELKNDCDKISKTLASMRIILINFNINNTKEWDEHKQNITNLKEKIYQGIKNATLANHAPVNIKQYN